MSSPVGPYAPAVRAGPWLVCSGQIGVRSAPDGPVLVEGGLAEQARQALDNVRHLLAGFGVTWEKVVKTTVFLTDMGDFPIMNDAYVAAFGDHRPARSAIGVVALPRGGAVEIEAWAFVGST